MNLLGKLSWAAIPLHEPIIMGTVASVGARHPGGSRMGHREGVLAVSLARMDHIGRSQAYRRHVSHVRAGSCLLRGFADAIMMRTQQAVAAGDAQGYLPPEHFDQIFSAHGTIMIFFVAMPLRDRPDEFCGAAAARRPRRGVSHDEFREPLADRDRASC